MMRKRQYNNKNELLGLSTASAPIAVGLGASLIGQVLLARLTRASEFGEFSYALAWITFASLVAKSGYDVVLIKMLPQLRSSGSLGQMKSLLLSTAWRVIAESSLYILLLLLFFLANPLKLKGTVLTTLYVGLPLVLVYATAAVRRSVMIGLGHLWISELPDTIARPVLLSACVFGLSILHRGVAAADIMLANLVLYMALTLLAMKRSAQALPRELFEVPREPFDAHQLKGLHGFSRLDNLVNIVLRSTDIILVGTLTSPAATAVYVVASRVAQAAGTFVVVLDPVVAPRISRLFSKGERPELERLARHYSYLTTAFSALFFGILFLFGSDIFALFGPEYRSAVGIAAIIAIGAAASAITGPTGMVLLMTGHQKAGLWITVLSTILYLGLLFILVPKYSVAGAAVASSAGVTVRNVLQALWIWRASGLNTTPLSLVFQADRNP